MVQAAHKHNRQVQLGTQRRSWPKIAEAVEQVRGGVIGRAYYAQAWYTDNRPSIGRGKPAPVPDGLDYDLWQGPAPRRPFHDNYLHYNWHWFWHWGNGELGNNGVHMIDVCRWALQVDYPIHVTSAGGRYRYGDDQETPDTHVVTFEFDGRKSIKWEGLSCNRLPEGQGDQKPGDRRPEVILHGENGSLAIMGGGYAVYDPKGKEIRKVTGSGGDAEHVGNFLETIRQGDGKPGDEKSGKRASRLNAEIEEGYQSTLLCHLGNIAHRTGRTLHCDPKNGHILRDKDAEMFWSREYEKGWEPKV
jgi:predicted dehydrogenase